ncbi:hypothetical protein QYM36_003150 [Artemia franciscana]|uniref:Nucleolar GTP-binding protein 2 n=1 Tax=Artemia franciscana TaxID=6661 RepID=A0AA88I7K0_ARTSF|nr:hypothetical protein QYM36_003150 [Artemia franciscana]
MKNISKKCCRINKMGKKKPREKPQASKHAHSMNPNRSTTALKGVAKPRDKATIKRLQMYRNFKAKRDRTGKIIRAAPYQSKVPDGTVARVEPNQRWFGNTRVVSQSALQKFQEELGKALRDPYQVVMKQTRLPVTLLNETAKYKRVHLLDTESFESVFGKKRTRKRPSLGTCDLESYIETAHNSSELYDEDKDKSLIRDAPDEVAASREMVMKAGQSKRIWKELYKVIDSSDVVIQVLDARDPMGTRCKQVEAYLKKEKQHKQLIFILNKVDLVPVWVTQRWVKIISKEYPTLAFRACARQAFAQEKAATAEAMHRTETNVQV